MTLCHIFFAFKMHTMFINKCRAYHFEPSIIFNTSGYSLCHKLCAQGRGASITLRSIWQDMKNEQLSTVKFAEDFRWNVYVITKKDKVLSRNLKVFKEYILRWNIL